MPRPFKPLRELDLEELADKLVKHLKDEKDGEPYVARSHVFCPRLGICQQAESLPHCILVLAVEYSGRGRHLIHSTMYRGHTSCFLLIQ